MPDMIGILSMGGKGFRSLNIELLGGILPRRRDIPDKNFMQVAFFCCFRPGVAGMSRDLGRDVPDLENFMQENFGAGFSFPTHPEIASDAKSFVCASDAKPLSLI